MILFHGGIEKVKSPLILDSQRFLDFGKGFYTTTSREQSENWATIKQKRDAKSTQAIVSVYEINDYLFSDSNFKVKLFLEASEEWLDFITMNRSGSQKHSYDLVKGAVANDTLYLTLSLYETGILTKSETIVRLKTYKLYDQISFHNPEILQMLVFIESYVIKPQIPKEHRPR